MTTFIQTSSHHTHTTTTPQYHNRTTPTPQPFKVSVVWLWCEPHQHHNHTTLTPQPFKVSVVWLWCEPHHTNTTTTPCTLTPQPFKVSVVWLWCGCGVGVVRARPTSRSRKLLRLAEDTLRLASRGLRLTLTAKIG